MKLLKVKINNYRNLDDFEVKLNKDINFIVGENNIGKTNYLNCLEAVLSCKKFNEKDFNDINKEVKIDLTLELDDKEIGLFEDNTDPSHYNQINITAKQQTTEDYIEYYCKDTEMQISRESIRRANIIYYDSQQRNDLDFSRRIGSGRFLNDLMHRYLENKEKIEIVNDQVIQEIKDYIRNEMNIISIFKSFEISVGSSKEDIDILSRLLLLIDKNGVNINQGGYGLRFSLAIVLSLLEKISEYKRRFKTFEREFNTIVLFDEPEIHLHPYLQRTLIRDILKLTNSKDSDFNKLLKDCFEIESINAQIIIVTHSPNILSDDYKKIIRLSNGKNACYCGYLNNVVDESMIKQIRVQDKFFKETFFARVVIIVEGFTEVGILYKFAELMEIDFDRSGIAVISANGAENILPLCSLYKHLNIMTIAIYDGDKKNDYPEDKNTFFTKSKCFESEFVNLFIDNEDVQTLENMFIRYKKEFANLPVKQLDNMIEKEKFEQRKSKMIDCCTTFNINYERIDKDFYLSEVKSDLRLAQIWFTTWLYGEKGANIGWKLATVIDDKQCIPKCYQEAINRAYELSKGVNDE